MSDSLQQKSISGFLWSFLDKFSIQLVQFVISLILARLLTPKDYGIVSLAYIVIAFAGCLLNTGMGAAIIQKKDVGETEYCTLFWTEAVLRIFVFSLVFFLAPFAASYYKTPVLTPVIRWIAAGILIDMIPAIPRTILCRKLDFRKPCLIGVFSTVLSGIAAAVAAYKGCGVWALVIQQLGATFLSGIGVWILVPWLPRRIFSRRIFGEMFHFGYKLFFSGILDTFYNNIYGILIGKYFSVTALGLFSKGQHLPSMVTGAVNGPVGNVSFPALSSLQDDQERFRRNFRKGLLTTQFFVLPMLLGLAATSRTTILVLYGEKWLPAVPFAQIMAVCFAFHPIHTFNLQAIMALGRTDIFLKLEIIKKIYGLLLVLIFIRFGLLAFVASNLVSTVISILVNSYPLKGLVGYGPLAQLRDQAGSIGSAAAMAVAVHFMNAIPCSAFVLLPLQVVSGGVLYFVFSFLCNRTLLKDNFQLLRSYLAGRRSARA